MVSSAHKRRGNLANWSRKRPLDTTRSYVTPWRGGERKESKGGKGLMIPDHLRRQNLGRDASNSHVILQA